MPLKQNIYIFCENIRYLRKKYHLTKREMADIMGIGVASLTKLEAGSMPPRLSLEALVKLARYFDWLPEKFFVPMYEENREEDSR